MEPMLIAGTRAASARLPSAPNTLHGAKFLKIKEDFMLLAVAIISTSMFILNPGQWKQVESLRNGFYQK